MKESSKPSYIYTQVVKVTDVYLGPAAERFIDRQVENHLKIEPSKLTKQDLKNLIDWIRVVVGLLTEDAEIVEEYIKQLEMLIEGNSQNRSTEI